MNQAILKYQGRSFNNNKNRQEYKETYIGTQQQIDTVMAGLHIGNKVSGKGNIESFYKQQAEGPYWTLQIIYATDNQSLTFSTIPDNLVGVKSSQLSVRNIQLPLQRLENYRMKWNYILIERIQIASGSSSSSSGSSSSVSSSSGTDTTTPSWWSTAGYGFRIPVADRQRYRWVSSLSEIPLEPQTDENNNKYDWFVCEMCTKPGVEYYDMAVFQVVESAKYNSAADAGSAIQKNINTICSPRNTFGINWGDWKFDDASVSYTGSYWLSTETYTHSGDEQGWDDDIYPRSSSHSSNSNSSAS